MNDDESRGVGRKAPLLEGWVKHMDKQKKRAFKNQLYEQFARIGKALSSPHRLELLEVLAQGEHSVEALAQETGMSVANASQHLQVLRAAQLVDVRREGVYIYYRLADEQVFTLWQAMRQVGEARIAEIDRIVDTYLHDRSLLQPIGAHELLQLLVDNNIILLDVRPVEEYAAGHLPDAISIPVTDLQARLPELPRDKEIVAYCRGPYCVFADEAVTLLRTNGYQARRLEQGLPDWRALGLPVESRTGAQI
jgi:rhodanese-related sulfurtransferase/DNA-binding MarR family transcriptional regulator